MLVNIRTLFFAYSVVMLLAGCAMPTRPQMVGASQEKAAKSFANESRTEIAFVNTSEQDVKVFWLDFSGHRKLYKVLKAGESYDQQTYLTHAWLVTDGNDNAWSIFYADAQPRVVQIVAPVRRPS